MRPCHAAKKKVSCESVSKSQILENAQIGSTNNKQTFYMYSKMNTSKRRVMPRQLHHLCKSLKSLMSGHLCQIRKKKKKRNTQKAKVEISSAGVGFPAKSRAHSVCARFLFFFSLIFFFLNTKKNPSLRSDFHVLFNLSHQS